MKINNINQKLKKIENKDLYFYYFDKIYFKLYVSIKFFK